MKTLKPPIIILLCIMVLLTSCTTTPSEVTGPSEATGTRPVFREDASPTEQYLRLFNDFNAYSGSAALGISGPMADKDKAIGTATFDALRYLTFNRGLAMEVRYSKTIDTDRSLIRFGTVSGGGTSDALLEECAQDVEIRNITWYGGRIGMAVFALLPGMDKAVVPSNWRTVTPVMEGWNLAVGTYPSTGHSMREAMEGAVYRSAKRLLDVDGRSVNVDVTLEGTDTDSYRNDTFQISGNRFNSFTVFAFDYDPSTGYVYALTGSKNKQEK